ncbi:MAG: GSCFA domain-containing protein, partial [Phyllobacterium sp.]
YRGETTNFHPMRESLNEPAAVAKYVGHGWFPTAPFITKDHYIAAFGSCFAMEVTKFLVSQGYRVFGQKLGLNSHIVRSGEGIVNSAALVQQFEWAYNNKAPTLETWHDKSGSAVEISEQIKTTTREIFDATEIFIFTLGLSEVWYDKPTSEIFWRAIPNQQFDPERHGFRLLSTEENRNNLKRVHELIRKHRPDAHIIMTLSPVPLAATFRPVSCITANSVSKASLRVAIDEVMREYGGDEKLHYYPSYEIATVFLEDAFGADMRHPRPETVDFIMQTFKKHFLVG